MKPEQSLKTFMKKIKALDVKEISEEPITFLEVMGCENREFVSSNLLAFFLDSRKQHQLKDLCLKALLSIYSPEYSDKSFSVKDVRTEVVTDKGNRIDILIETTEELIIIENKIYHFADNDFKDYESHAQKRIKQLQKKEGKRLNLVKILLGLKNEDTPFKFISHFDFIEKLEEQLKNNRVKNNYTLLLNQYIDTMDRKNPDSKISKELFKMNKDSANFIQENLKELEKLELIKENAYSYYENLLSTIILGLENSKIELEWFQKIYRKDNVVGVYSYSKRFELKDGDTYEYWLEIDVLHIIIGLRYIKKGSKKTYQNTKERFGNILSSYSDIDEEAYVLKETNTGLSENEIKNRFIEAIKKFETKKCQ